MMMLHKVQVCNVVLLGNAKLQIFGIVWWWRLLWHPTVQSSTSQL